MQINFENLGKNQKVDNGKTNATHTTSYNPSSISNKMGYTIDISGNVKDNNAYAGQGKTAELVQSEAASKDVLMERNYMAVMSNSMSKEDFHKLVEDGYDVKNMSVEDAVTIIDKIKATMASSGQEVAGYTDNISSEELEKITGSKALASAIEKSFKEQNIPLTKENVSQTVKASKFATDLSDISDNAKAYMVENQLEPTIQNLYFANHSTGSYSKGGNNGYFQDDFSNYLGKKADYIDYSQIENQIKAVLAESNLEINSQTMEEAKWLIDNDLLLNQTNIIKIHELNQIEFPRNLEETIDQIAKNIASNNAPMDTNLLSEFSIYEKANKIVEEVEAIDETAIEGVISKGKKLTIATMYEEYLNAKNNKQTDTSSKQKNLSESQNSKQSNITTENKQTSITAKLKLEEIRLAMTCTANISLLRKGFSVDTAPLEEVITALKEEQNSQVNRLYGSYENQEIFDETLQIKEAIQTGPIDVVAHLALKEQAQTLHDVYENSKQIKNQYQEANKSYETMMTQTRADLGDSIGKAFQNVDAILEDLGLEITKSNQRAIRILGYNQMEMNLENVYAIKNADLTLEKVLSKLSPSNTLGLVKKGRNPLTMSIEDLYEELSEETKDSGYDIEKFAKFVQKLDNSEATEEEKESCIGIYRLIRQIEKGDRSALGTMIDSGQEMTLENLLSAIRTKRTGYVDKKVDDNYTGSDGKILNKSISKQITSYYDKVIGDLYENLESKDLLNNQSDLQSENRYQNQQLEQIRNLQNVSDETIQALLRHEIPVTYNNAQAMEQARKEKNIYNKYDKLPSYTEESKFIDEFDNKETAVKNYETLTELTKDYLSNLVEQTSDVNDIRELSLYAKQLSIFTSMAKNETFEIPMVLENQVTNVSITLVHSKDQKNQISLTFETEELGKVEGEFKLQEGRLEGTFLSSTADGCLKLKEKEESIKKGACDFLQENHTEGGTKILYQVAKQLLKGLSNL